MRSFINRWNDVNAMTNISIFGIFIFGLTQAASMLLVSVPLVYASAIVGLVNIVPAYRSTVLRERAEKLEEIRRVFE